MGDAPHLDPRVARTRDAVRRAVRTLVQRAGIEAVTHSAVALEAGVGRATVYRHWPDRTDLLLDAFTDVAVREPWSSSGQLTADLLAALDRLRRVMAHAPFVQELVALIGRAEWDEQLRAITHDLLTQGTAALRRSLEAAIERGELDRGLDVDAAVARLAGPLFYRRLLANQRIDRPFLRSVVEAFVQGTETT